MQKPIRLPDLHTKSLTKGAKSVLLGRHTVYIYKSDAVQAEKVAELLG